MGYLAGDVITAAQYNIFVNNSSAPFGYNHFAGTGSGEYGLGQTEIATVAGGNDSATTITASQFNTLLTAIDNIANHTNDTMTARTSVAAGDEIAIKSNLEADLATLAASVAAGSPNATALTESSALQTVTTSSEGWDSTATQEVSVTFANANTMRHFFNAGGKVRITVGTSQTSTSPKDQAYIDLGTALGNIDIASQATTRSGSGETLTTNGLANGFHDLGTGYTSLIKLTSDNSNYTSNNIEIFAKLDDSVGDSTVITVKVVATDGAADDQYTSPNTESPTVPADIKDTPKIVTTLKTFTVTDAQGLASAIAQSSTATVSNSTS
jgi:hypothetical protein|tara:strand:+ start:3112 stop:4089 length:978 start_codon:yes stop_codon:yes gene_type:complete